MKVFQVDEHSSEAARSLLHHSHLAVVDSEDKFAEFEFAIHHIWEAFSRWSSEVHAYVSAQQLPVQDVSVLQVIRMNERPKSAADIGKFLNRDDSANILYGLRKLEKAGLIEKTGGPVRQTAYRVTERGREVTDQYAAIRRNFLLANVVSVAGSAEILEQLTKNLWLLTGFYEQAARKVSMMSLSGDVVAPLIAPPAPAAKPKKTGPSKSAQKKAPAAARSGAKA